MDGSVKVSKELKHETQASKKRWVGVALFFFSFLGFCFIWFLFWGLWFCGKLWVVWGCFFLHFMLCGIYGLLFFFFFFFFFFFSCGVYRRVVQKTVVTVRIEANVGKQKNEGPPSDFWSWRKYGQKPIKGSPYPRFSFSFFLWINWIFSPFLVYMFNFWLLGLHYTVYISLVASKFWVK